MDNTDQELDQPFDASIMYDASRYSPSVSDVMKVKSYLFQNFGLPIEIIDTIIDTAEYWPHTSTITTRTTHVRAQIDPENQFILRSYPLGFLPSEEENQHFQMLPEYKHAYQSMEPQPWPESRQVPSDATDEVLNKWEATSKPRGEHPCRKIVFTINSRDQGWGGGPGRGTYEGSFTWFDAGMEKVTAIREATLLEAWESAPFPQFRLNTTSKDPQEVTPPKFAAPVPPVVCSLRTILPHTVKMDEVSRAQHNFASRSPLLEDDSKPKYMFEHPLNPSGTALQKNVVASREKRQHIITWSCDDNINPESAEAKELEKVGRGRETGTGELVRNMKTGDVITVWAKARYGQWVNHVEEVKIDVYWAV